MVDDVGKWDHPEAVKVHNEPVTALVSITSKLNLHSHVKLGHTTVTVGEAQKIRTILRKEEMENRFAARPIDKQESLVITQLFQDTDTKQLYWRQQTNSFLGVRHECLDPIIFNQSLSRAKTKLQYITTIGQGRLPTILEETSSDTDPITQYLSFFPQPTYRGNHDSPVQGTQSRQSNQLVFNSTSRVETSPQSN